MCKVSLNFHEYTYSGGTGISHLRTVDKLLKIRLGKIEMLFYICSCIEKRVVEIGIEHCYSCEGLGFRPIQCFCNNVQKCISA